MPYKCSVPQCRGNYDDAEKVHIFGFPNEKNLRDAWIASIPRKEFTYNKNSKVCEKHFTADSILWESTAFDDASGKYISAPLRKPKLKENAIPTIFPNCPKYFTSVSLKRDPPEEKKKSREERNLQKAINDSVISKDTYDKSRTFSNFEELKHIIKMNPTSKFWETLFNENFVMFLNLNNFPSVKLDYSVVIDQKLKVTVSFRSQILHKMNGKEIPSYVKTTDEIFSVLDAIESLSSLGKQDENILHASLSLIKSVEEKANDELKQKLNFISEQLLLICKTQPEQFRYSPSYLVFSSLFYLISPQAYKFVRDFGLIILPHYSTIHKINLGLHVSPQKEIHNKKFLSYAKLRFPELENKEKYISVMMDEIHIKQFLDYKGGDIVGIAHDNTKLASSAYVFMLQSLFSKYKDVIHILPVVKITGESLYSILKSVILGLENIGFRVVVVVSDNNSINRKCMSKFNNPISDFVYPHPCDPKRPLFFCVDTVHLIKCVRNNWINQKNCETAMYYPHFDNSQGKVLTASFKCIRDLYELESGGLLKYGYTLSRKALWPTNLEKQSVKLALQIFNDSVFKGLLEACKNNDILNCESTASYIQIFSTWFKIVNTKSITKGFHLQDEMCGPLTVDVTDPKFVFLNNFLNWLEKWDKIDSDTGRLTRETYSALLISTKCIIELTRYCISELHMTYILPGKIQTDELEYRFSLYRRMAGTQYHVSIRQIYEIENKLRVCNLLKLILKSNSKGNIEITDFFNCNIEGEDLSVAIPESFSDFELTDSDIDFISEQMPLITYLSGYCVHSVLQRIKCDNCKASLTINKTLPIHPHFKYIHSCDRGGLKYPAIEVVNVVAHNFAVAQKIIGSELEKEFLLVSNQRFLLTTLTMNILLTKEMCVRTCDNHKPLTIVKFILRSVTNTLLKNFCKLKNDSNPKVPNKRKLSTLKKS